MCDGNSATPILIDPEGPRGERGLAEDELGAEVLAEEDEFELVGAEPPVAAVEDDAPVEENVDDDEEAFPVEK